jgi:hypothetical protein
VADIFFSYTKADRARIQPLIAALKEQNWTVWWDSNIYGGDSWSDVIEAELTKARCVIVAWSQLSAKSAWVKEEARAANKAQKLVPVLLDSMEPPFGFGGIQAVDLSAWDKNNDAPEFQSLCAAIRGKLGSEQSVSEKSTPAIKPFQPPAQARAWPVVAIIAAVLAIIVGILTPLMLSQRKDASITGASQNTFITSVQRALCVIPDGIAGPSTIAAVGDYLKGMRRVIPASIDPASAELMPVLETAIDDVGNCASAGFKNAFEVGYFGVPAAQSAARTKDFQEILKAALRSKSSQATFAATGKLDAPTRQGIMEFRRLSGDPGSDAVDSQFVNSLRRSVLP